MKNFEEELKRALRRCEPPEGFADRVLARVGADRPLQVSPAVIPIWNRPILRWAAVAAMVLIGAGGLGYRAHEQRVEEASGQAAKQQVMLALRITGSKLRLAQKKVKSAEGAESRPENTL